MQNLFTMISLVDLSGSSVDINGLRAELDKVGTELGVSITVLQEEMLKNGADDDAE